MSEPLEDPELVAAFEASLKSCPVPPYAHYPEAVQAKLGCQAWPLRPLFLRGERLQFIARSLYALLEKVRERLSEQQDRPEELAASLGFPPNVLGRLDLAASLASSHFLSLARPDGFFYPDRFVVSELNVGSGLLATLCYTEILHRLLTPALQAIGWDTEPLSRPFPRYLKSLGIEKGAHLALLAPSAEVHGIYPWEKTMYQQVLETHGVTSQLVTPAELSHGRFDLVVQVTSGETCLSDPSNLSSSRVHPSACLMLDKGLLPWLQSEGLVAPETAVDGFQMTFPHCFFPDAGQAEQLRLEKDRFVLKRAWEGKDTLVGCATHGRAWNRAVAEATDSTRFIAQEYHSLPTLDMPYLIDGEVQRVPVRIEVSPFLIEGQYAGALVRYAPDREGVLLSPSPSDLGMTLVYST